MASIDYSATESIILGLKIGRCNTNFFDETELYNSILNDKYDLVRLKVCAEDEYAPMRLEKTGIPYFFSGSIRRYKTKILSKPEGSYNYPDLKWEQYDGSQEKLLKDMLIDTWGDYPIGYYRSPYLSQLISKEMEIESVFQFYKNANLPRNNPNNGIVFIKHGDNYVGFFATNIVNGNLESHIGGILKPYRKGGYFLDKLRYIKEMCVEKKLTHFVFGARNENSDVQRIFHHVGFQGIGSENTFHIASLLSHNMLPPVYSEINLSGCFNKKIVEDISKINILNNNSLFIKKYSTGFFYPPKDHGILHVKYSFPITLEGETIVIVSSISETNETRFLAYIHLKKR